MCTAIINSRSSINTHTHNTRSSSNIIIISNSNASTIPCVMWPLQIAIRSSSNIPININNIITTTSTNHNSISSG